MAYCFYTIMICLQTKARRRIVSSTHPMTQSLLIRATLECDRWSINVDDCPTSMDAEIQEKNPIYTDIIYVRNL